MKRFFHWFARLLVRPVLSAGVPVWLQRFWSNAVGLLLRGPGATHCERDDRAGVRTLRLTPTMTQAGHGVLYMHGGGYIVGGFRSHAKLAAWVGQSARSRVWLPEYRLAPEHACPAALKDALAVYAALVSGGQDAAKLALVGDSAGGGLALATAVAVRDSGLPPPAAIVLFSPWVDLSLSGDTISTHAGRDAMLKHSWLRWCATAFRGTERHDSASCSPLFANLSGLPPILIHVGSEEILLSDAQRLAQRIGAAGGQVTLCEFEGAGHVFQFHAGLLAEADSSVRQAGEFIRGACTPRAAAA